jgi:hypothetical protein
VLNIKMKTINFEHILSDKEISHLQKLIGKDLCGIGSDSISIQPSLPELWRFHKWIEFSNWTDNLIQRLVYSFDETYSGDDFLKLRIESLNRERKALKADISFAGNDKFTIQKIETYGYDSEYEVENLSDNIPKVDLKRKEKYNEKMRSENAILLYSTNGKQIWVECLYPYLELIVTMNQVYIEKRKSLIETEFNAKMKLKREIK